jgi:hypothetical protein
MRIVVIDFESFFTDEKDARGVPYTLSRMTTENYVRHAWFEAHGAAIKWGKDCDARWYDERQLREVLKNEDWSDVMLVAYHMQFDGLILSHCYSVVPRLYGCALAMARLLLGNHISVSLDSVRQQFNLPAKRTPYNLFKGKHWRELDYNTQRLVAEGACDEVESIWTLFGLLSKRFPTEEYQVIDTTVRMFTQPVLRADTALLAQIWEREENEKSTRLADLGVCAAELQSADRFAELLRDEGVEPETKEGGARKDGSPPKQIYAFAKTDPFMEGLLENDDPRVRALAEARLGQKSTLMQTRAETLGWMASRGPLCVYLRYAGAHTTRWSGGDKCLTADTLVLVFDYQKGLTEKRIVDILMDDLVWDGEAFVAHGGIAFRGYQEVIEHDGVRGTAGHVVFTKRGEISLAEAAETGTRILDCRQPTDREMDAVARGEYHTRTMPVQMRTRKTSTLRRAKKRQV